MEGGLRLCYPTLGAFTKYPKESLPEKPTKNIADKKYGFFQSEKAFFAEIAHEMQLKSTATHPEELRFARHPLAFLVEAADDICYTIIDFEDGINLGLIPEDLALEYLGKLINQRIITEKYSRLTTKEDRIAYLRAIAIGTLIEDASATFMKHENAILNGDFHRSLLSESVYKPQIDDIIDISVSHIYRSPEVVEKEISGYAILQNLLDLFYTAVINDEISKTTSFDRLILSGLPEKYRTCGTIYERIMGITCYIASLTDGKALELHLKSLGRL